MNPLGDFEFREMHEIIKLSDYQFTLIGNDICVKSHSKNNFKLIFMGQLPYGSHPKKTIQIRKLFV